MSKSGVQLPNLLKPTALDRPVNQRLETSILYPATANQKSCKFVFDRKGILDANSQLELKVLVPKMSPNAGGAAVESGAYFPTSTGIAACVRRAYLEIGGRRVATLDEVGQYITWRRLRWSPEYREQICKVKQGGNDVFVGSACKAYPIVAPFGVIGRPSNEDIQLASASESSTEPQYQLHSEASQSPSWVLSLAQLIPMLRGVQLPLFAIAQEVSLVVEFSDIVAGEGFVVPEPFDVAGAAATGSIHIPTLKIMADYLFYPEEMDNLSQAIMTGGGYDIFYDEVQTQSSFEGKSGANFDFTAQLALGGKKVKSIITGRLIRGTYENNIGNYYKETLETGSTYNFTIDSKPFYAQSISNAATLFAETSRIDDTPLRISQHQYSFKNGGNVAPDSNFTDRLFNGYAQTDEQGQQKWVGLKLCNAMGEGRRMSNLPVLFRNTGVKTGAEQITDYTHLFFITTQRMVNISNGLVNMIE